VLKASKGMLNLIWVSSPFSKCQDEGSGITQRQVNAIKLQANRSDGNRRKCAM
jgi:hypothetical protein